MKPLVRYIVIGLVVLVFLAAMATYTVRFNETAVVSTFGKATEESVVDEEGLGFVWPYIQRVTKYDTRARYVETAPETTQTREKRQLIVTAGLTWKVSDPLKFYKAAAGRGPTAKDHYAFADEILRSRLRGALSDIGQYRFDQLIASTPEGSELAELEKQMLESLRRSGENEQSLAEYGVTPLSVGIVSMALPMDTTRKVFEGMNLARQAIANEAVSQGTSRSASIRSSAEADAKKIRDFANRLAARLQTQGDVEAASYIAQMNENPDLAVFLQTMDFMKNSVGTKTTTLVLPTSMPGIELFTPDALRKLTSADSSGFGFARMFRGGAVGGDGSADGAAEKTQDDLPAPGALVVPRGVDHTEGAR